MDEETLKRQIVDDVHSELKTELREIKRQKTRAEEELESASERWRAERRRLNSEIDRLESTLADSKPSSRRKGGENQQIGVEVARVQAEADDKLRKAAADWDAERNRLNSQILRLESAVTEAIERSSNPHRSSQPAREQFEVKLQDAAKERLELEQQLLRVRAAWDEDKKKLTGEIIKLRRLAPPSKAMEAREKIEKLRGRSETVEEARIHELEEKLTQAHTDIQKYQQAAVSAREETRRQYEFELEAANRERLEMKESPTTAGKQETGSQLKEALHGKQLAEEHLQQLQQLQEITNSQHKPQLEAANRERAEIEEQFVAAARKWEVDRQQLQHSLDLVTAEQAEKQETRIQLEEALREKQIAEERLQQLHNEVQRLKQTISDTQEHVAPELIDQLRLQYEEKIQKLIEQKTELSQQLQSVNSLLESERFRTGTTEAGPSQVESNIIQTEIERVGQMIRKIEELIDNPATELSTVIRKNVEKAELDAYVKGILFSSGRGGGI